MTQMARIYTPGNKKKRKVDEEITTESLNDKTGPVCL
jgi:hypothetical protein